VSEVAKRPSPIVSEVLAPLGIMSEVVDVDVPDVLLPHKYPLARIITEVVSILPVRKVEEYVKGPDPSRDPETEEAPFYKGFAIKDNCKNTQWLPLAVLLTMLSVWALSRMRFGVGGAEREGFKSRGDGLFSQQNQQRVEGAIARVRESIREGDTDATRRHIALMRQALVDRYSGSVWVSWSLGVAALLCVPL
jgi:hypothetical protein